MTDRRQPTTSTGAALIPTGDIGDIVRLGTQLQAQASDHNIHNVFDDGGYKELLLLKLFGLKKLGRTGDDAIDDRGRQYEIKTVARVSAKGQRKTSLSITTEHTLTIDNIKRYRSVHLWIIAVFNQAQPEAIYEISPAALEPRFAKWEAKLAKQQRASAAGSASVHLNNPKIPLKDVQRYGIEVWPADEIQLPLHVERGLDDAIDRSTE